MLWTGDLCEPSLCNQDVLQQTGTTLHMSDKKQYMMAEETTPTSQKTMAIPDAKKRRLDIPMSADLAELREATHSNPTIDNLQAEQNANGDTQKVGYSFASSR